MILIFVENLADPADLVATADHRIWSDDTADHHWELSVYLDALGFPSELSSSSARILLLDQKETAEESSAGVEQVEYDGLVPHEICSWLVFDINSRMP